MPLVARAVLDGNDAGEEPRLDLRGYVIGNGVTDREFDGNALVSLCARVHPSLPLLAGASTPTHPPPTHPLLLLTTAPAAQVPFARGATLISEDLYQEARRECGGAYWNASEGGRCDRVLGAVGEAIAGVNLYDVLVGAGGGASGRVPGGTDGEGRLRSCCPPLTTPPHVRAPQAPCYHGHNPYSAVKGRGARREALSAALATHRAWPLLGGVREGPVPGFRQLLGAELAHTPSCLDSRCAQGGGGWRVQRVRLPADARPAAAQPPPALPAPSLPSHTHTLNAQGDVGVLQRPRRAGGHPRGAHLCHRRV